MPVLENQPCGHSNIHGTLKNDPLIVENENCMNVQVRMFRAEC